MMILLLNLSHQESFLNSIEMIGLRFFPVFDLTLWVSIPQKHPVHALL